MLVSLFVSFSLDPMLSAYWPDPHLPLEQRPLFSRILGRFNHWFDRRAESYKHVIAWALDHRVSMLALAFASFVGALALPATGLVGSALVPEMDNSMFVIDFETPPGSNLAYTRAKAQEAARIARKQPEVAYTYTSVSAQGDAVDEGTVFVKLTPKAEPVAHPGAGGQPTSGGSCRRLTGIIASISVGFNPGEKQIQLQVRGPGRAAS